MLNKNKEHKSTEENYQEQQQNSFVTSLIHFPSPYRWESGLPSFHQTPMGYLKAGDKDTWPLNSILTSNSTLQLNPLCR